ncbi:MAG TPA: molybdopterin-guanine dinucleotide biosynthesis protein MobB, partial [Limnochordia bacterium]|nr:molybdopterin-guanine dinucleotide biosynthesis protein MobB [Limnochordia bacterium]
MPAPEWHEALARLLPLIEPLGEEWVPVGEAAGRVAACDLGAPDALPRFRRAMMDGYLCHRADLSSAGPSRLRVTGRSEPGRRAAGGPARGEAWAITTGSPLPELGDMVIPQERAVRRDDWVEPTAAHDAPANVAEPGEDLAAGEIILRRGERIGPRALAPLVASGLAEVAVVRRPRALILTTGDELVRVDAAAGNSTPPTGKIYDVHAPLLAAELRAIGLEVAIGPPLRDEPEAVQRAFTEALSGGYDAIITTGGVSVGERDYVRATWTALGAETLLDGIRLKPGGRCFIGRAAWLAGSASRMGPNGPWLFGLSGNPAAGLAAFHLLVRPLLLRLAGCRQVVRPLQPVTLAAPYAKTSPVTRALWSYVGGDAAGSPATPLSGGQLTSPAQANALLLIPGGRPAQPVGAALQALRLDRPEVDPPEPVPIIAVRGASGSGKTTLIVALAAALRQRGLRVACVKHAAHGFELDKTGSDSDRLRTISDAVLLASPAELALRLPVSVREPSGEAAVGIVVAAHRHVHGAAPHLVLVEGYSGEPWPYVEVGPQKTAPDRTPRAGLDDDSPAAGHAQPDRPLVDPSQPDRPIGNPPLAVWPALTPDHPALVGAEFSALV